MDTYFNQRKALHFAFEARVPEKVWNKMWQQWYDNAVLLREPPPLNCVINAPSTSGSAPFRDAEPIPSSRFCRGSASSPGG
ncbi:MAG: hypothetical protein JJU00_15240 [Opitutales bacterium]|nr:hypothetical protein [Opitutales bacterium]